MGLTEKFVGLISSSEISLFLLSFICQCIDCIGAVLLCYIVLKPTPRRKLWSYFVIILLSSACAAATAKSFELSTEIGGIAVILAPISVFCLSKKTWYKMGILSLGFDAFIGIISSVFSAAMGKGYDTINPGERQIYNLVSVAVMTVIVLTVAIFVSGKRSDAFSKVLSLPMYLLIVGTALIFTLTMIQFQITSSTRPAEFALCILNIVAFTVTIVYALKRFVKTQLAEQNYKNQLSLQISHVEMMEKKNEELRVFRHDMPKLLRPLAMYIQNGNYDDAMKIVEEFHVSIEKSRPRFSTGNYHLDTVLEAEQQLAEKSGIQINLKPGSVFPKSGIDSKDICTIFLNALDNAIEACVRTGEKAEINLDTYIMGGSVFIKISNPFVGSINSSNGNPVTSKSDKESHGYGFRSIKKTAAKYGGDNVSFSAEDGIFTLMIMLTAARD